MKSTRNARYIVGTGANKAQWTGLQSGDLGVPIRLGEGTWPRITASGSFSGASVILQGSHGHYGSGPDWTMTWHDLSPPPLTAPGTFRPLHPGEQYQFCRPIVLNGDELTSIDVGYHSRGTS